MISKFVFVAAAAAFQAETESQGSDFLEAVMETRRLSDCVDNICDDVPTQQACLALNNSTGVNCCGWCTWTQTGEPSGSACEPYSNCLNHCRKAKEPGQINGTCHINMVNCSSAGDVYSCGNLNHLYHGNFCGWCDLPGVKRCLDNSYSNSPGPPIRPTPNVCDRQCIGKDGYNDCEVA